MEKTFYTVPENEYSRLTDFYLHLNGKVIEKESLGKQKPTDFGGGWFICNCRRLCKAATNVFK